MMLEAHAPETHTLSVVYNLRSSVLKKQKPKNGGFHNVNDVCLGDDG